MSFLDPFRIFFFGDSICFGQGVSLHKGWVAKISSELSLLGIHYKRDVVVVNSSVSGNTTRQALERMPYDVQSQNPDALIIQFGMNDCNYWETDKGIPRVSPDAFFANLNEIIDRALVFGTKRVFLHTNHPSGRDKVPMPHVNITYQQSNKRYNEIIRSVAQMRHSPEVILSDVEFEFERIINGRPEVLASFLLPEPDLLHLSEAGHGLYYDVIYPVIRDELSKVL